MPTQERLDKIQQVVKGRQQGIVIIEDVYDPHNAAAAVRSCDAFGIQEIWLIFHKAPKFNPRKIGKASSTSANKWVDFRIFEDTAECIAEAKRLGYEVVATVLDPEAESLYKASLLNPKTAILLGTEKEGLTEEAISIADRKVYIPMRGFVQSLNLSVTTSIFLYEMTRQRIEDGMEKYVLRPEETKDLETRFTER